RSHSHRKSCRDFWDRVYSLICDRSQFRSAGNERSTREYSTQARHLSTIPERQSRGLALSLGISLPDCFQWRPTLRASFPELSLATAASASGGNRNGCTFPIRQWN